MNVLKLHLRIAIETLLRGGASQREIERHTGVDRKTIRRVAREANSPGVATGSEGPVGQIPPPWPPVDTVGPAVTRAAWSTSACEAHRSWIESQVQLGRNAVSIYQDLVEQHGFAHRYNSVKRIVHGLKQRDPERFDVLEADLTMLIKLSPDRAHAYNALGYSFADRSIRLEEARTLIEKAISLAPDDLFIVDSMGWTFYRMGDHPRALEYLRRAWQGRPDGEIGAHLGEVLWVMGERVEAERIWQEAVKNSPDNEALLKTIKRFKSP